MICKVINYNKYTHTIIVDYGGTRVQFVTHQYTGENKVNVEYNGKKYSIINGSAQKVTRRNKTYKQIEMPSNDIVTCESIQDECVKSNNEVD